MNSKLKKAFLGLLGLILPFYIIKIFSLPSNLMPTVTNFAFLEPQPMNFVIYFGFLSVLFVLVLGVSEIASMKLFCKKKDLILSSLETGWTVTWSWF